MMLMFFTVVVYVFFIYGVIEFTKKVYLDIMNNKKVRKAPDIQVIISDIDDLEYIIRTLKKHFNQITFVFNDNIEKIPKTISEIGEGVNIEYRYLGDQEKAREL